MLTGHEAAWMAWRAAMAGSRMHHAWLLTGRAGLGKARFAQDAARAWVGGDLAATHHPDVLHLTYGPKNKLETEKRDSGKPFELSRGIKIDQVREMQRRLITRPTLGDRRAVVIEPADDMEGSASNALLKSLEEPPAGTVFLLVSHNPARLLPTIRSRCRVLRFLALPDDALAEVLARHAGEASAGDRDAAIAAAAGSPGAALAFVAMGLAPVAKAMRQLRDRGDSDMRARADLAALIGTRTDRERMRAILDLAAAIMGEGVEALPAPLAARRIAAHGALSRLAREQAVYNYDPGLFALEIGTLLSHCAAASSHADG